MTFQTGLTSFEDHTQWKAVKEVCRTLKEAGYQALLAGGCVRDLLMKREPNDFDIASDATPDQVEALFPRALTVGKAFGVTILPFDDFQIEVATFREDLEYVDGRRPEGVRFSTAKADAQRRDFTVNALFFDLESNAVIDYVDGQKDIAAGILRTVGKPELRFEEDKLRLLRAIRFAAQLNFRIEPVTLQAVKDLASDVSVVSRERIRDELEKLLKSPNREKGLKLLLETKVLESSFPELAPDVRTQEAQWLKRFEQAEMKFGQTQPFDFLFWLSLFVFPALSSSGLASGTVAIEGTKAEKEFRDQFLKTLKIENQLSDQLLFVLKSLPQVLNPSKTRFGVLAVLLTKPGVESLLKLATLFAELGEISFEANYKDTLERAIKASRNEAGEKVLPYLTGQDLKVLGIQPGPKMGELIQEAYLLQLESTFKSKDDAIAWAKQCAVRGSY